MSRRSRTTREQAEGSKRRQVRAKKVAKRGRVSQRDRRPPSPVSARYPRRLRTKIPNSMRTKTIDRIKFNNSGIVYSSKAFAQQKAEKYRSQGRKARVVPVSRLGIKTVGYTVYYSRKGIKS